MSTTEYIIVTSIAPTYGRVSPEATRRDHQLRDADGSARIARVAIDEPPEPPSARIAVEPALGVQPRDDRRRAARPSPSTAAPRSPAAASAATSAPAARATSSRVDVRLEPDGSCDARVDEQHVDAVLAQPVAQERVLGALRVERPDAGRPVAHPLRTAARASGSTPR